MKKVLIIDDDSGVCKTVSVMAKSMGYDSSYALTLAAGMEKAAELSADVVFLDINLPDGNGIDAIGQIKKIPSAPEVIILTGHGTSDGAEIAIKSGAWDFLEKPIRKAAIELPLKRVFQFRKEKTGPELSDSFRREAIVGKSKAILRCLELAEKAAANDSNVLITGETGTGKELFARAIHENSSRSKYPFVIVDCAALPDTLIESTLFGHRKGAFTGADTARDGLILQADSGSLFLDEVAEMPLDNQRRFLRVLQERRFRPVGSDRDQKSNFRLVAATNKNLIQMVKEGTFREDLYFRLRALEIKLPPLRKRLEEINELALWAAERYCKRYQIENKGFLPEFLEALKQYTWPGNVRELIMTVESAISNAGEEQVLHPVHLPVGIRAKIAGSTVKRRPKASSAVKAEDTIFQGTVPTLSEFRDASEKRYFQSLLTHTEGNIKKACRLAGVSKAQFYRLLGKHNIARGAKY